MIKNHSAVHTLSRGSFLETKQSINTGWWETLAGTTRRYISKLILFVCIESILISFILIGTGSILMLH